MTVEEAQAVVKFRDGRPKGIDWELLEAAEVLSGFVSLITNSAFEALEKTSAISNPNKNET